MLSAVFLVGTVLMADLRLLGWSARRPARASTEALLQQQRDIAYRHEIARQREESLAIGRGVRHRANVQIGDVAHVDGAEVELR